MFLLYVFLTPIVLVAGTVFAAALAGLFLHLCEQLGKDRP